MAPGLSGGFPFAQHRDILNIIQIPEMVGVTLGNGYIYRCPKCGHEEEYLIGVGFMGPTEREEAQSKILAGDFGPEAKITIETTPALITAVDVEWALYQCPACLKLDRRIRVISSVHALKVRNHQFCDNCGKEMHHFRRGMKMICPSCREPMVETDLICNILWD